jgi:MFS family permease
MGTGSTLVLLPPQNATGNFVKVVQRLPVRIDLVDYDTDQTPLFIGTSVAPVLITVARLLQGFSVGGEFGSAVSFLVEHAGDRKGYSASWQWASTGIISVIVSIFGVTLTTLLTHQQLIDWGWRIPYVFGLLVGPVGLYIRAYG